MVAAAASASLAIVFPFILGQIETRLMPLIGSFASAPPCGDGPAGLPVRFVFYSPQNTPLAEEQRHAILDAFAVLPRSATACLAADPVDFATVLLPDAVVDRHPDGPCAMFWELFSLPKLSAFDYMFVFEPDVMPLRAGWAQALHALLPSPAAPVDDFWVRGSAPQCHGSYAQIEERGDQHINGNALYKLHDDAFAAFRDRVRHFYPAGMAPGGLVDGCSTGAPFEGGHDNAMFQYLRAAANFDFARSVRRLISYTSVVVNLCEEDFDAAEVLRTWPFAYLAHSKGPLFSAEESRVRRVHREVLGQNPSRQDLSALAASRLSEQQLLRRLCGSTAYLHRVERLNLPSGNCTELCAGDGLFRREHGAHCGPGQDRMLWRGAFANRTYVYSADVSSADGPVALAELLEPLGGLFLHVECAFCGPAAAAKHARGRRDVGRKRLRVVDAPDRSDASDFHEERRSAAALGPCPNLLRRAFYESYRGDAEFQERVDFFFCAAPAANCELFLPFGRPIVLYLDGRLEDGRLPLPGETPGRELRRLSDWLRSLSLIAGDPSNVVAAATPFEASYCERLTGFRPVVAPIWPLAPQRDPYFTNVDDSARAPHDLVLVASFDALRDGPVPTETSPAPDAFASDAPALRNATLAALAAAGVGAVGAVSYTQIRAHETPFRIADAVVCL